MCLRHIETLINQLKEIQQVGQAPNNYFISILTKLDAHSLFQLILYSSKGNQSKSLKLRNCPKNHLQKAVFKKLQKPCKFMTKTKISSIINGITNCQIIMASEYCIQQSDRLVCFSALLICARMAVNYHTNNIQITDV